MTQHHYIFDFDSTLVTVESLDELAKIALKGDPRAAQIQEEIKTITRLGMEGEISFPESLSRRLKLFSASKADIEELVELLKRSITDSVLRNLDFFESHPNVYIVSGGFREYILPIAYDLTVAPERVLSNEGLFGSEQRVTSKVELVRSLGLAGTVHVIGDGYTDYEIRKEGAADDFIVFTENVFRESVVKLADHRAATFDEFLSLTTW